MRTAGIASETSARQEYFESISVKLNHGMNKKITIRIGFFILAAFGIFMLYSMINFLIPRHGSVANISELRKEYQRVPEIAVTFTNDLVQKFPFQGNVKWTFSYWKARFIDVTGKVDTNA